MQIAYQVLQKLSGGDFYSGQRLAQLCKVSRARVWQAVELLRSYGLNIHAVKGKGYSMLSAIELIDTKIIQNLLKSECLPQVSKLEVFNQIDSTNDYILRSLSRIEPGFICLAEGQAKGRGRRGKGWFSPLTKNIAFSYYQVLDVSIQQAQSLSLVVGIAVVKAIESLIGTTEGLGIKWPNDIWYHGAKLCGILVETHNMPDTQKSGIIIGIGLNTHHIALEHSQVKVTSIEEITGKIVSRNQMIAAIINELVPRLERFYKVGIEGFIQEWKQYDILQGKPVTVTNPQHQKLEGVGCGINEQGAIVISHDGVNKAYYSGDIKVRPYATTG